MFGQFLRWNIVTNVTNLTKIVSQVKFGIFKCSINTQQSQIFLVVGHFVYLGILPMCLSVYLSMVFQKIKYGLAVTPGQDGGVSFGKGFFVYGIVVPD